MKHAREDYNRIQDPAGLIPDDEPVFLLRGQDVHAPIALLRYAELVEAAGGDQGVIDHTRAQALRMGVWQTEHRAKAPDMPEQVAP